jgi:hypothetical protein
MSNNLNNSNNVPDKSYRVPYKSYDVGYNDYSINGNESMNKNEPVKAQALEVGKSYSNNGIKYGKLTEKKI